MSSMPPSLARERARAWSRARNSARDLVKSRVKYLLITFPPPIPYRKYTRNISFKNAGLLNDVCRPTLDTHSLGLTHTSLASMGTQICRGV